jgi:sugar phosphate permease
LLLVPAIAWSLAPEAGRPGWQLTALALGIVILVAAFPLSRLIHNRPQDYHQRPDGDPPEMTQEPSISRTASSPQRGATNQPSADLTASQALRTPAFWLISFGHGFTSMVILAIMSHLGLLLKDRGFGVQTTGWIVAVYTAVAMGFQLVGGYMGDSGCPKT